MSTEINSINRLVPGLIEKTGVTGKTPDGAGATEGASFADMLGNYVESVNDLQSDSGQIQDAFLNGEPVELHQVMIKGQQAGIAMDLLLEIRNKLVNGFQQIMRMPM